MGFALARKHARRLRAIALILMSLVPSIALLLSMASPAWRPAAAVISIVSTSLGLMTERWLFFAQARHLVMTYYDAKPG
jgi:DMSO reductase anchor subunit